MSSVKCLSCGLVNFGTQSECRRCGAALRLDCGDGGDANPRGGLKKKIAKSALRIFALAGSLLFIGYASLIATSDPARLEQKPFIDRAIEILETKGFAREAFVLRHIVRFRASDNWWNRKVGHESAYAATNFPFEVVTLYPPFFDQPVDDVERASILLHEACHLLGSGEHGAFESAWRRKTQLGWTRDKYEGSLVWTNVREATMQYAPELFQCGQDHRSDCVE